MKLYFFRHGKAGTAANDFDRELTAEGVQVTQAASAALMRMGVHPEAILSSPRVRARQTADILGTAFGREVTICEELNFDFNVLHLRTLLAGRNGDSEIFFVGHNPGLSEVTNKLTAANINLKTSGMARVDSPSPDILSGELVMLVTPKLWRGLS